MRFVIAVSAFCLVVNTLEKAFDRPAAPERAIIDCGSPSGWSSTQRPK